MSQQSHDTSAETFYPCTPQDTGVDLSPRTSSVQNHISFFSEQWLHHQADLAAKLHTDLLLVPGDGQGIQLHLAIVLPQSSVLTNLLDTSDDLVPTILLPQVDRNTVLQMVDLLYTGECLISLSHFHKLNHLLNSLGFIQLLKTLNLNASCSETIESHRLSNCWKLESDLNVESMGETVDSDEVLFIKMIFSGAHGELLPLIPFVWKAEQSSSQYAEASQFNTDRICVLTSQVAKEEQIFSSGKKGKSESGKCKSTRTSDRFMFDCDICGFKFSSEKKLKVHKRVQCENAQSMNKLRSGASKLVKGEILNRKLERQRIAELKSKFPQTKEPCVGKKNSHSSLFCSTKRGHSTHGSNKAKVKPPKSPKKARSPPGGPAVPAPALFGMEEASKAECKTAPQSLASRAVIHCRNNIRWVIGEEKFNDSDASWVRQKSVKDVMEFQDLTEGEKAFYCVWNQFLLDHSPGVCKVHLRSVLDKFIALWGREVKDKGMYRQFVAHLIMMEREGLVGQETLLGMIQRLQECVQSNDVSLSLSV